MDRGAWRATVRGVAKGQTRLLFSFRGPVRRKTVTLQVELSRLGNSPLREHSRPSTHADQVQLRLQNWGHVHRGAGTRPFKVEAKARAKG